MIYDGAFCLKIANAELSACNYQRSNASWERRCAVKVPEITDNSEFLVV